MKTIKGAIFDVDGTLLDSMGIWENAAQIYLERQGLVAEEGLRNVMYPMTLNEGGIYLKENYGLEGSVEEILQGLFKVVEDFYISEVEAKPEVAAVVKSYAARGIPMIIATNNDSLMVERGLRHAGLWGHFQKILTCGELNTSKNEPLIYQTAAEIIGCRPEETAVYEDVLHASQVVKNAGFHLVGVYDQYSSNDWDAIEAIADEIII